MKKATRTKIRVKDLAHEINSERFHEWNRERRFVRNIQEGKAYFNGPRPVPEPTRHSPSELLQCHRKIAYRQQNAPGERSDPRGIFWFGTRFEDEIALPFLQEAVTGSDTYACNSLWVDFDADTDVGEIRIKGETDPVIVDSSGEPLLLTEIKTKRSVTDIQKPNDHHKAQAHAYMKGLSEKHNRSVTDAIILYGGRTQLDIKVFYIEFDPFFWTDTVLDWATEHTVYRLNNTLPPAAPEYEWECEFCPYRGRCGRSDAPFKDLNSTGLLPLTKYPRNKLNDYLEAYPGGKLTPTTAHQYPELMERYKVYNWRCERCAIEFSYQTIEWDGAVSNPPLCPSCCDDNTPASLRGPIPENQISNKNREQSSAVST